MNRKLPTAHRCVFPIALAATITGCATPLELPTASSIPSDRLETLASSAGLQSQIGGTGVNLTGGFYPLQLGNHWLFRTERTVAIIPTLGDPSPPYHEESTSDRQLVCVERRDGRDYVVEEAAGPDPLQTARSWRRLRQDRTGLYEADVSNQEPPPCGAGVGTTASGSGTAAALARGMEQLIPAVSAAQQAAYRAAAQRLLARLAIVDRALRRMPAAPSQASGLGIAAAGELTRLSYPLHVGARWTIRAGEGVTFTATVEAADLLDLRVGRLRGYRIQIRSDLFGPADVVRVWYGPSGYLQLVAHLEADVVGPFGQVIGRGMFDERETLVFLHVAGPAFTFVPIGSRLSGR